MRIPFTLADVERRAVPNDGEETGSALRKAGELLLADYQARGGNLDYVGRHVAQIFSLAADAYTIGAARSMGHNRSARYEAAAAELRRRAAELAPK